MNHNQIRIGITPVITFIHSPNLGYYVLCLIGINLILWHLKSITYEDGTGILTDGDQ